MSDTEHIVRGKRVDRGGEAESRDLAELLRVLELEVLDRDLFRAQNPGGDPARPHLFGGQVAAQAAHAASLTVPDERRIHSLHGYFLRAGRSDRPTILRVDRDRDGRSYSARHVSALQDGQVIMSLLVSFHSGADGFELEPVVAPVGVPAPDDLADLPAISSHWPALDLRVTDPDFPPDRLHPVHQFWARTRAPLPDDPELHACLLTYLSDIGTGLGKVDVGQPWWGPSLDHAVWFHRPARMDEWVLVDLVPGIASQGRGFYTGTVHDRGGRLIATIAQEHVMRPSETT